jgi:GTPase
LEPRRRDTDADGLSPTRSGSGRAIVIGPYQRRVPARQIAARGPQKERLPDARLEEAVGLARAIDLDVVQSGIVPISHFRPATYMGAGKVVEIAGLVKSLEAGVVIADCALSPVQQRNLEKAWNAKVLDRTGLILEIFGRRAHTKEGGLQVELAHLT